MVTYFFILGVISIITGIILGFQNGAVILGLISGIFSGSLFLGIALIIEGQHETQELIQNSAKLFSNPKSANKICNKCKKSYQSNQASCPYCGNSNL